MWKIEKIGLIDFQEAYAYQEKLVKAKQDGEEDNFFLLMEHSSIFTRGKGAKVENILDKSIPVHTISRGGDLTCHEPGQLVGYIILDLRREKLTVKQYISKIEDLIISSLKQLGINAYKNPELVGVWLEEKKIASIGIGIKKRVTMHGFALNVNNNLEGFKKINPCGLEANNYSSLKSLTKKEFSMNKVQDLIITEFKKSF